MINLTPSFIEVIPARDKIQRPVNTDSFDLSQLFGGWLASRSEFRKGSLNIKANDEQILAGSATARLTGTGIFFGKDTVTGLYEFRAGNPSGNYFHYDGTDLTLKGGTITAGSITIGTNAWHVDTSGNMWWGSAASYAAATIKISSAGSIDFTTGTFSGTLSAAAGTLGAITAGTFTGVSITATTIQNASSGARVVIGDATNEIDIYASASNEKSTIIGLTNELRLSMATNGGFVTLQANNDAGVLTEVLRADGDAGVTVPASLALTTFNIKINKTGTGTTRPLDITNSGTGISLFVECTHATVTAAALVYLTTEGKNKGVDLNLTNTANTAIALEIYHSGTGYVEYLEPISNASRTKATLYLVAVATQGAHLKMNSTAGSDPGTPTDGDIWYDGTNLKIRVGSTTYTFNKTAV